MKFILAQELKIAYLCIAIGIGGVLAFTWLHDQLLGPTFSPVGGILLNTFSFLVTLVGFVYSIRSMWNDMMRSGPSPSIARIGILSLLAMLLSGLWVVFYVFVLIVPLLFGAY